MNEYAPQEVHSLADAWVAAIGSAEFSGIVGDSAHTFGYHRGANYVPSSDYSRQLDDDRVGVDGEAACALDIKMSRSDMILVTGRLRASADDLADPRLNGIREFAGTLDGDTTFNYDTELRDSGFGQWDDSHLWHVHVSFLRSKVHDAGHMTDLLGVVLGESWNPAPDPTPTPIPTPPVPVPPAAVTVAYPVQPGDTLSAVARVAETTYQRIAELSGVTDPNRIVAGQVLTVPVKPGQEWYAVVAGDSLSFVAARYGTTWQALAGLNAGLVRNPNLVRPGQLIRVR